jgi:hypothetical protein
MTDPRRRAAALFGDALGAVAVLVDEAEAQAVGEVLAMSVSK